MKKLYLVIGLFGLLMACTNTPPLDRIFNKETVIIDMKEIKELLDPTDFSLLEDEINDHYIKNEELVLKISYSQILDSIKDEIQKEREKELEAQRLIEEQPLQLLGYPETGFEEFTYGLFGKKYNTVGYLLKGSLINMSEKTFVKVEFEDKNDPFWGNARRNPYVEINLNNPFRLSCVDFGPSFSNWSKIKEIKLPEASYESPWNEGLIQDFEFYFQPDITRGYYIGVDDYGECLQPVHFNYEPNSCILIIPIYLEDAKGYKKQMFLSFDIMSDYENFAKTSL